MTFIPIVYSNVISAQQGSLEIVEKLLSYGVDVKFQNSSGKDSLMLACFTGKFLFILGVIIWLIGLSVDRNLVINSLQTLIRVDYCCHATALKRKYNI